MFSQSMTCAPLHSPSRALSKIASTLALLALCACSSNPPKFQVEETKQPPQPVLPTPDPVAFESFTWRVVVVSGEPLIALDPKDYEALARNLAELARWAGEASYQIEFYRRRQEPANE